MQRLESGGSLLASVRLTYLSSVFCCGGMLLALAAYPAAYAAESSTDIPQAGTVKPALESAAPKPDGSDRPAQEITPPKSADESVTDKAAEPDIPDKSAVPSGLDESVRDLHKESATAKAVSKAPMPLAGPIVAAEVRSRYEEYLKANAVAKSFDDVMPFQSKQLRERMASMKIQMGESEKLKGKSEEEKKKAWDALFQFFNMMAPRTATVVDVKSRDDIALVDVTSSDMGLFAEAMVQGMTGMMNKTMSGIAGKDVKMPAMKKPKLIGKVYMLKEDGQWNLDGQSFETYQSPEEKKAQAVKDIKSKWCAEATKLPFPQKSVYGKLHGAPFVMRNAEIQGGILTLRSGTSFFPDQAIDLFIFGLKDKEWPDGQTMIMSDGDKKGELDAHIHMKYKVSGKNIPESETFMTMDKPGVKLQFGRRKGGMLPGYISMRLPDKLQSNVQGYFYAVIK